MKHEDNKTDITGRGTPILFVLGKRDEIFLGKNVVYHTNDRA